MSDVGHLSDSDIDEIIEHTCWQTDRHIAPYVGGFGTPVERRAALLAAYTAQEIAEEAADRQIAFSIAEGPALDRIDWELRQLATARHAFNRTKTEGQHLVELGRYILLRAEAWAEMLDNDPLADQPANDV